MKTGSLVLAMLAVCGEGALAQSDNATITGRVTDSSPAVIPKARVVATNLDTELRFATSSNLAGYFTIPALPPGPYRLEVVVAGFKRFVRDKIVLEARRIARLDVTLELGQVSQSVQVSLPVPLIETETSSLTEHRTRRELDLLPKGSATEPFMSLVAMSNVSSGYPGPYLFSIAGARTAQYDYAMDGISNRGEPMTGAGSTLESVSELTLHSVNNSAEFGSSAVISVVSKGGTNRLHGDLSYYHTNSALNARDFFAQTKPEAKSHAWGIALEGPVYFPRLYDGRNRTFFSLSWHGERNPGSNNANATVPSDAMRRGDFSSMRDSAGNPITIRDPLNGQPFPGNVLSSSRLDPVSLRVQDRFYLRPNFGSADLATLNYRGVYRQRSLQDRIDTRLDHKLSDRNLLFARWGTRLLPQHPLESNLTTIGLSDSYRRARNAVLSDSHTFSPEVVNEFRYGFRVDHIFSNAPLNGLDVLHSIGLEGLNVEANTRGLPQFSIDGMTMIVATQHTNRADSLHEWIDSLTVSHGLHTWKVGVDVQRHACCQDWALPSDYFGAFNFSGLFTGLGYSDFLLGLPQTASRGTPRLPDSRQKYISSFYQFYIQDDIKIRNNLTVNLGVRYEYAPIPSDQDGLMFNVDTATGRLVVQDARALARLNPLLPANVHVVTAAQAGWPRALRSVDGNNLVPRAGIAWRFLPHWVLRGAYGIFVDALRFDVAPPAGSPLFGYSETFQNFDAARPVYRFPDPFGAVGSLGAISPLGISPHLVNPYVQQWNATLEREIQGTGWRLSYIGTKGTKLAYQREMDAPPPGTTPFVQARLPFTQYRSMMLVENGGNSIYHGLQLEVQRRLASGLSFQSSWTWSKAISDVDDQDSDAGAAIEDPFNRRRERAPQGYSFKHRWTTSLVYELPFGQAQRCGPSLPALLNRLASGWTLGASLYFQSGLLFNPTFSGTDPSGTGIVGGRPDRLADGNLPADQRTLAHWFDVSAFAIPAANRGSFGTSARNVLEGPGLNVQHFNLVKSLALREKARLQLLVNVFNAFNHPGFDLPNHDLSDPASFGRITSTRFLLEQKSSSRSMLLQMRLQF